MNYYRRLLPLMYIWFTISLISMNLRKKFYFTEFCLFIHLINIYQAPIWYLEMVFHRYLLNVCIQCAGTVLTAETWHI